MSGFQDIVNDCPKTIESS